ncbi:MAG: phosphate ABC transporter substrate-binding protein PstS family protein [Petrotogaceae bacterium]|jgi:phosphate transport system substrate-binding protein|nr:phosphate ABC transporter substrate-binding protein PstS family protein [Petrotogaceae bacterium]
MKKILVFLVLVVSVFSFSAPLVVKGSNTVLPIAQMWAEEMKKLNPSINITLEGAGSSTGISALFNNTTDIANSSRWLKASEIEQMGKEKKLFMPIVVAYDGIAVVVNKSIKLENITISTLKDIYTGKITTWNQIDPNLPKNRINVYSRNTASGTYETFSHFVLGSDKMSPAVRMVESTQFEADVVLRDSNAIAYMGIGYVDSNVKVLKVEGVMPSKATVLDSTYIMSRPLYMFINATEGFPMTGPVKEYFSFATSKRGQELVEKAGFIAAYGN